MEEHPEERILKRQTPSGLECLPPFIIYFQVFSKHHSHISKQVVIKALIRDELNLISHRSYRIATKDSLLFKQYGLRVI